MIDRSDIFKKRLSGAPSLEPGANNPTSNEIRDRRSLEMDKLAAEIEKIKLDNNSAYPALDGVRVVVSDSEALVILRRERSRVLEAMQASSTGGSWTKCVASLEKIQRLIFDLQGVLNSGDQVARPFVFLSYDDAESFVSKYLGPCPADFPG